MLRHKWTFNVTLVAFLFACQSIQAALQTEESTSNKTVAEQSDVIAEGKSSDVDPVNLDPIFNGTEPPTVSHLYAMQEHFKQLVDKVRPATVGIQTGNASGSGVIVSRDGYVLTAAHVIMKPDRDATIILQDGTKLKAKTLGMNHGIDSGMLKITDEGKWPYLDLGESEPLQKGQWVMAIGHPGGFDDERAPPIRVGRLLSVSEDVLQSDCTLVGGDSGGPLVDMNGNVIGIHSRIGGYLYQNYHVPVDTYLINWDDLAAKVEVGGVRSSRPKVRIGVKFEDDDSLVVESVINDGPAAKAGIQKGDLLYKLDDRRIRSRGSLRRQLLKAEPDKTVEIVVKRGEEELKFDITFEAIR